MRTSKLPILLTSLVLAGGVAACDDEGENSLKEQQTRSAGAGAAQVAASDVEAIIEARQTITDVCGGGSSTGGGAAAPDEPDAEGLQEAVEAFVTVVEEGPSDRFESGQTETPQTMSSVAEEAATALERCGQPVLAKNLRDAATGETPVQKGTPGY